MRATLALALAIEGAFVLDAEPEKSRTGSRLLPSLLGVEGARPRLLRQTLESVLAPPAQGFDTDHTKQWDYNQVLKATKKGKLATATLSQDGTRVLATDRTGKSHALWTTPTQGKDLQTALIKNRVNYHVQPHREMHPLAASALLWAPLGFFSWFLWSTGNSLDNGNSGSSGRHNFGARGLSALSRSKFQVERRTEVKFDDVAGCNESKQELQEVVEFLKDPAKFDALGAKIPRGVLMEGPPGTGKTLLARAVAGEAGVPFFAVSASEFVEVYVGVGASRVRDLFSQARNRGPCIIFIDEIDAVGSARGRSLSGNDEREQTLNQILTEMDGFDQSGATIVIAATNRADILDKALLRPGRFDRRVAVDLPDVRGRLEILKVHSKGKPLAEDVRLELIAQRTMGFSGASLANLLNEAAIVAARHSHANITYADLDYALDRLTVGQQKSTGMAFKERQKLVAYHEAGHAIVGSLIPGYDLVTKVTIVPRSNGAGGFTLFTPSEERLETGMMSKSYLEAQLTVMLGGRVAEELIFGPAGITTGASNDLQQVRSIARRMITEWGYGGDQLGATAWESPDGGRMSQATEEAIDQEVMKLVGKAYKKCKSMLRKNRRLLDDLAEKLLEKETVDFVELYKMVGRYHPAIAKAQQANFPPDLRALKAA